MILYFQNSKGIEREIGQPTTYAESISMIEKFIADHKFKSYYTIVQKEYDTVYQKVDKSKNRYIFDVGSHTEFFILDVGEEIIDELVGI